MADRDGSTGQLDLPKSAGRPWWKPRRREARALTAVRFTRSRSEQERQSGQNEKELSRGDAFGRAMESFARAMGTPAFLVGLSVFVVLWVMWNSMLPQEFRFDSADLGFTALTLMLSLQASYAAPMILLAQNRQDDRDRVTIEQDRQHVLRNTADLEYLAREIVALRMLMKDMASKDFIRAELRALLEDIEELDDEDEEASEPEADARRERPGTDDAQRRRAEALRGRRRAARGRESDV